MFTNMSLMSRLVLGFGLLIVLVTAMAGLGYWAPSRCPRRSARCWPAADDEHALAAGAREHLGMRRYEKNMLLNIETRNKVAEYFASGARSTSISCSGSRSSRRPRPGSRTRSWSAPFWTRLTSTPRRHEDPLAHRRRTLKDIEEANQSSRASRTTPATSRRPARSSRPVREIMEEQAGSVVASSRASGASCSPSRSWRSSLRCCRGPQPEHHKQLGEIPATWSTSSPRRDGD